MTLEAFKPTMVTIINMVMVTVESASLLCRSEFQLTLTHYTLR